MIETGKEDEPGINSGLGRRDDPEEEPANTIDVPVIDVAIKEVIDNGGIIIGDKMPVPGVGWLALFKDPEGHKWGMMQTDTSAK